MTYKEAWEAIHFRHCEETCDYAYMDNCQEGKCEYYMALQALNRQYYAECGSVWTKPLADRKTEPNSSEIPNNCEVKNYCDDCLYTDTCDSKEFFYACTSKATISKMEQVDKPQTEYRIGYYTPTNAEILKAIKDEPQTDCAWK